MGGTILLAYTIQKDKTIYKNKNHSCSVILGFHMSNQKKGFALPHHCYTWVLSIECPPPPGWTFLGDSKLTYKVL